MGGKLFVSSTSPQDKGSRSLGLRLGTFGLFGRSWSEPETSPCKALARESAGACHDSVA